MPRKPKAPFMLQVEGLSEAKCFAELQAVIVDDFDGRERQLTHEELAQHVINNPKMITDWRKRARAVRLAKEYLEAKTYTDQRDHAHKLLFEKREQTLAHNQRKLNDSLVITVHKPKPKWRRL